MEQGKVLFFDSRDNKRFGFILTGSGEEIFFHFNDGENVEARGNCRFLGGRLEIEPKKGDAVVFERVQGREGRPKASPWGFYRRQTSSPRSKVGVDPDLEKIGGMIKIIRSAKPGDTLKIVFADKTFDGDLRGRLYMLLAMADKAFVFDETIDMLTLRAVADSGRWEGFRTYFITLYDGFDPEYFISRTIDRSLLESIEIVA